MSTKLVLVGGGDHARVLAEAARSREGAFDLLGFVDPQPCVEISRRLGLARLGDDAALIELRGAYGVIAVGPAVVAGSDRQRIAARLSDALDGWARIVHARAWVSPTATVQQGAAVLAGAIVQTGASIGAHAVVNNGAVIEHDVDVGAFAHVAPGAVVGGGARLGAGCMIGLGARVRDHVHIGDHARIGMGAVVVADVAPGVEAKGVPAR